MKYFFLIASIAAFNFVAAQENGIFYFQKLIQKKNKEKQKFSFDSLYIRSKNRCWESPNLPFSERGLKIVQEKVITNIISHTLPNGNKIYSLPQDNMPCIVPDMSQFNMPNRTIPVYPYRYNGPGAIPNPVSNKTGFIHIAAIKNEE